MNDKGTWKKELRAAFPHTLPVLTGYLVLGIAYGVLLASKGYGVLWAAGTSLFIYAGSMQFVAAGLLTMGFQPLYACLMTLMVNARHVFYGISMLDKLRGTGRFKPYLILSLSDETFSLLSSLEPPEGIRRDRFLFFIALLDHGYWVAGSALGGLLGSAVSFNTVGIDFVLTAMFTVIFINQWRAADNRLPAVIGVAASLICLILLGPDRFLIPAMVLILLLVTLLRRPMERGPQA